MAKGMTLKVKDHWMIFNKLTRGKAKISKTNLKFLTNPSQEADPALEAKVYPPNQYLPADKPSKPNSTNFLPTNN
jgi:hypothetical protein